MHIVLVGLNHRTAPVALREQLALADCGLRMALEDLDHRREPGNGRNGQQPVTIRIKESVILSTCNRMEVYAVVIGSAVDGWQQLEVFLAGLQGIPVDELHPHLYFMEDQEAVVHLMRVATGLDSMVLGEPQILGQVSSAQGEAHTAGTIGPVLSHLFDLAVHAGKRARTETDIGRHTTSISHAAANLVREKAGDLSQLHLLVVGAGEMAEVAAQALLCHGAHQLSFINRTYNRAESLAQQFNGRALNWYHLPAALTMADAVICATGAPHIVIHADDVRPVLSERNGRPLLFVDIAVPRDVEEAVGQLHGVRRLDVDQLQSVVDANLAQRQTAIPEVEVIISEEADCFDAWLKGRQVLPVLVELRRRAQEIANEELERNQHHLEELAPEFQEKVNRMVHRIVNKMLHEPTVRLKNSAAEGNGVAYAHALRELFALDSTSVAETMPVEVLTSDLGVQAKDVEEKGSPSSHST
jgi:glutamyl-tRNA reductase